MPCASPWPISEHGTRDVKSATTSKPISICASIRPNQSSRAARTADKDKGRNEILKAVAGDHRLASALGTLGSAWLTSGQVRSSQLATAKANDDLAKAVADLWRKLGRSSSPPTAGLKGYLSKPPETKEQAVKDFKTAQAELEKIARKNLKTSKGGDLKWIYQAELANAYLAEYRLTRKSAVLKLAKDTVAAALEDKQASPFLEPVRELAKLIDEMASR